jgi:hypothetical protein
MTSGAIHRLVPTLSVIVPGVAERTEASGFVGSVSRAKPKSQLRHTGPTMTMVMMVTG